MLNLNINDIILATNGKIRTVVDNTLINDVSTSSKEINAKSLFIPIIGESKDGHMYMEDAYQNGCRNFLIDKNHEFIKDDINLIEVDNTTKALGYIARYYKKQFDIPYIGVTGSVGKTSTKDIIASVLKEKYQTLKNEGNFNNEIGLPKTLFNLDKEVEIAILEMGMSFKGEIQHLASLVEPNVAIISNVGMSHIENFDNQEGIFNAKMEITSFFNEDNTLIINGDDENLKKLKNKDLNYKLLTYGFSKDNDIVCLDYEILEDKIKFRAKYNLEEFVCSIPSIAKHNIYNSLAAILVGKIFNLTHEQIIKGLENFSITKGRLTTIKKKDITIIDDSYNASSDSMISALNVLKMYKNRRIAILGDILETGKYHEEIHRNVGKNIFGNADYLITVGNDALYIKDEALKSGFLNQNIKSYDNYEELIKEIDGLIKKDDVVLLKSSHGTHLDKVVEYLEKNYED